jgi:hypothetical protein
MGWAGAPAACRPLSFPESRTGSTGSARRQLYFPSVRRYPRSPAGRSPVRTQERVEAGLNRLLLAVPGPLTPGRNRQHPTAPHSKTGMTRLAPPTGALALCQARVEARDEQVRGVPSSGPRHRRACASCRRRNCGAGIPDRPVTIFFPEPRPRRRMPLRIPGGRRGDVSRAPTKGGPYQSVNESKGDELLTLIG